MSTPLEDKLRTAADGYTPLSSLLKRGNEPLRWWDSRLPQNSRLPAVVVLQVSNPKTYSYARQPVSRYRMQFTIWAVTGEAARQVETALASFLDQFNAVGIEGLEQYSNQIVNVRGGLFEAKEPPDYLRIVDAMIYNNDLL